MRRTAPQIVLLVALPLAGCSRSSDAPSSSARPIDTRTAPRPITSPSPGGASSALTAPPPPDATQVSPLPPAPSGGGGEPMPDIATVRKLTLTKEQGGPAIKRCSAIAYEVEVDLVGKVFAYRVCDPKAKGPPGKEALTRFTGTLAPGRRSEVERAYATLRQETARGCGADGGPLTLTLTFKNGKSERWFDQNWGCKQPPPQVAHGLHQLRLALMNVTSPE